MGLKSLFNTIKYLKPIQIVYRIKNSLFHTKKKSFSNVGFEQCNLYIKSIHSDNEYLKRFSTNGNKINILNQEVELDYSNLAKYSPLIQFNIQYFEYGILWSQTGVPFETFKRKWNEYLSANLPLHPYVISLQIPNLIITMNLYGVYDQEIYDEIYSRYKWLLKNQEKHLLCNHYFENLKAILLCSRVFKEEKISRKYERLLVKELNEEILDDGVHFERSLMYHKLILEDLLVLKKGFDYSIFDKFIQKMLDAVYSSERGFSRTPLFNDAGDNVAKTCESLVETCKVFGIEPHYFDSFNDSGYFKIDKDDISLLIDAGLNGPRYNLGHTQCDCLSFELFVDEKPVFVNCGTYQYQGDMRSYFRSTEAHNTFKFDGKEQSECWGEHRVARRISQASGKLCGTAFSGSFKSAFGIKCSRTIEINDNALIVVDSIDSTKELPVESYLHLAPGLYFDGNSIIANNRKIRLEALNCEIETKQVLYSPEFGKKENITCLVFKWKNDQNKHGYKICLERNN